MRRCAAVLAVVLAVPAPALGRQATPAEKPAAEPGPTATPTTPASSDPDAEHLGRIKRRLAAPTTVQDAALNAPAPTFRVSISEKVDLGKLWDDKTGVSAAVRPSGGPWHHEFQDMVTPDEFKGYGAIFTNGEKMQLAATSLAFAGAMQLLTAGIGKAKEALDDRAKRKAKIEVQSALEEFYQLHPEARPASTPPAPATPVP